MTDYVPPADVRTFDAMPIVSRVRPIQPTQASLAAPEGELDLFYAGHLELVERYPVVAVVGTRKVSKKGAARARRLAKELAEAGVVVMSGLARGVDTEAMTAVAKHPDGKLIGVIATAPENVTPKANGPLQQLIYTEHLLITEYGPGTKTKRHHFPARNKVMALLSDATVIVEASETSGTIHQASECKRLGRHLFFLKSMADEGIRWVDSFLGDYERAHVLESTDDLILTLATGA